MNSSSVREIFTLSGSHEQIPSMQMPTKQTHCELRIKKVDANRCRRELRWSNNRTPN